MPPDAPGTVAITPAPEPPHSGLGIASIFASMAGCLFNAVAVLSLAAVISHQAQQTAAVAGVLRVLACFYVGLSLNVLGLALGLGGLAQKNRQRVFPVLGSVLNGGILLILLVLGLVGIHRRRAQMLPANLLAPNAAHWASDRLLWLGLEAYRTDDFIQSRNLLDKYLKANAGHPLQPEISRRIVDIDLELERNRQLGEAIQSGYESATVADMVADPGKFDSKKVAFSGVYAGQSLDWFFVWGKFGKGGNVQVNGSKLSAEKKKALLGTLDGFHKVLIKGVCLMSKYKPLRGQIVPGMARLGLSTAPYVVIQADEVLDLGRAEL